MDDVDKKIITMLARKIGDANNITSAATNIILCASSVSRDKFIIQHNERSIKKDINKIKDALHKIGEYVEELETHVYNGKVD